MREILFRGQTRKFGQKVNMAGEKLPGIWAYGGIFPGTGDYSIIFGGPKQSGLDIEKYVVYSETVGQFTGMTDKNGTKIFEGDIVRFDGGTFVVEFYTCRMGFCFSGRFGRGCVPGFTMTHWEHLEVIGNIHDNPELLEERKDDAV